ncbi:MAG: sensor histidine kinase [Acutalibacteraceae bacterium]
MSPISYLTLRYKNCSMRVKLFASFFLLIFIPIIVLTVFAAYRSTAIIQEQSMEIARLYLQQTENEMESELYKIATVSSSVAQTAEVHEVLEKQNTGISFSEEYDDMNELYKTIESTRALQNLYQIRLFISDSFTHSRSNYITYPLSSVSDTDWYHQLVEQYQTQALLPPSTFQPPLSEPQEVLSVVTLIRSRKDITRILGVVSVDVLKSDLIDILQRNNYAEQSAAYLVDENLNIVCGANSTFPVSEADLAAQLQQMRDTFGASSGVSTAGNAVYGLSAPIFDGWRIFTVASMGNLLSPVSDLRDQMIWLTVIISIIAFCLSYLYARYSTRRIKTLAEQVRRVENGDLSVSCIVDSEDEIGELQNSFNFMVRRISLLVDERYNLGKNLKDMELRALQAQINPHFLYNTLDMIAWKAMASGNQETVDIVVKLARFYRLSLSNGSDFLPLSDEVEHVRLFVELTNLCRSRNVQLITEVAPNIADYPIMKLILQPIIENSLFHGLYELSDRVGVIRLTAEQIGSYVQIQIADNGVGIEKSKLAELLAKKERPVVNTKRGGYGIGNILERLRIYYDDRFTFQIESAILTGTTVTIRIPYSRNDSPQIHAERTMNPPE